MKSFISKVVFAAILIFAPFPFSCWASNPVLLAHNDITELSLEELMDITVTSVSRKENKLSESAAAIYVISSEDIRRSGATSIPDALRMVPGLQVARINSSTWAISARGFNNRLANKLLVLIDGRTVYHAFFSGVVWRDKDVMLEDVERIEVIRGPGASMWGANAVNGIINIITQSAQDTQGGLISAGAGDEEKGFGAMRYGGKVNEDTFYRAYFKGFDRDEFAGPQGENTDDNWHAYRGGFRIDGDLSEEDSYTIHGDVYDGHANNKANQFAPVSPYFMFGDEENRFFGANILGKWDHAFSETSDMALQVYYDRIEDKIDYALNNEKFGLVIDTFDIDFQHRFRIGERQDFIWGLGFRFISDNMRNASFFSVEPVSRDTKLFSAFVHDEITLIEEKLKLLLGSKFEKNDYSGFEVQPNARFLWTPRKNQTVWGAVSRSVRTPSRSEHDIRALYVGMLAANALYPGSPTAFIQGQGDRGFDSEELIAYELGYRFQPTETLSFDIAAFYNDYDNLESKEAGTPFLETSIASPHLAIPLYLENNIAGETRGVELSAQWQAFENWRLQAIYSYLRMDLYADRDTTDSNPTGKEGESPRNQFAFRSSLDLPMDIQLDAFLRYVDDLPDLNIGGYVEADINLGWRLMDNLDVTFTGRNLLDASHPEFDSSGGTAIITEIQRSFYGKVTWQF